MNQNVLKPGDKVLFFKENGKITLANSDALEEKLQELAHDPEIQREISAINQEFENTEMDGLEVENTIRYCLGL